MASTRACAVRVEEKCKEPKLHAEPEGYELHAEAVVGTAVALPG